MSKLYKALNVTSEKELLDLVESLELDDNQYIEFMTALDSDLSEDGYRLVLENLAKSFDNGSYEKLQEQFSKKKPSSERKFKKIEDWDIYYGGKCVGHHKLERDLRTGKGKTVSYTKADDEKIDEDTVYDHSWYEVEGQKYPKRTKEGVTIKEGVEDLSNVKVGDILLDDGGKPYIVTEVDTTYGEDKYGNPANYITLAHYDGGKARGSLGMPSTGLKYIFHKEDEKMGDELNESASAIDPKVLDKLYSLISDQMGDMYMSNYDEVDFDNLLDSVDDFGREIDGYNPALKADYAQALKAKWEDVNEFKNDYILDLSAGIFEGATITEAKNVEDEPDNFEEKPVEEEKPVSTADPELEKFIEQSEKVIDATTNSDILMGLVNSIEAKLQLATDVEQMNKLGELKSKAETKANASNVTPVAESYEYNPDDEEWFDIGDQVSFKFDTDGNVITGTVRGVKIIGGNRYYDIASYNREKERVENYTQVDPVGDEMKKIYEPEDVVDEEIDETCSGGCCSAGSVASFGKRLGKAPKKKKRIPEAIDTKLFKESILNDMPCESSLEGHTFNYFMNEGRWYLSCNNALVKTFDKDVMLESIDEIINGEEPSCGLLEGYSCYEMNILMEDISANSTVGSLNDEELKSAIISSALKSNDGKLNPQEENELEKNADDPEIQNQNKKSATDLSLKVGQQVDTVNPTTSELEQKELSGVDKEKGLAYLKDKEGKMDVEPASKVQIKA